MTKLFAISATIFFSSIVNFPIILATIQINVNFDYVNAFEEFRNDENAFNIRNVKLKTLSGIQNGLCSDPKTTGKFGRKQKTYCTFEFSDGTKFVQRGSNKAGSTISADLSFDVVEKKTGKVVKNKYELYYFSAEDKIVVFIHEMRLSFLQYIGPRGRNYEIYH